MPSPYERHRPVAVVARSPTLVQSSAASLDFPMPAGPRTVKSRQLRSSTVRSKAWERSSSSSSLPTMGACRRRATPGASWSISSTRRRPISSRLPLTGMRSSGPPEIACEHLARVDADPALEPQLREGGLHLLGRAYRPEGVVLVRDRHPEDRHHLVADELLDRSAMALDDRPHRVEEAGLHPPVRLGVSRCEPRRVDEVAKEDCYGLTNLPPAHAPSLRRSREAEQDRQVTHCYLVTQRSTPKAMLTVVRYSLMWSSSTTALMETTSAPWMSRTVFAASRTAASAALAKLSDDRPMTVMTFAISAMSAPSSVDGWTISD